MIERTNAKLRAGFSIDRCNGSSAALTIGRQRSPISTAIKPVRRRSRFTNSLFPRALSSIQQARVHRSGNHDATRFGIQMAILAANACGRYSICTRVGSADRFQEFGCFCLVPCSH
jgi:hypothetical protein